MHLPIINGATSSTIIYITIDYYQMISCSIDRFTLSLKKNDSISMALEYSDHILCPVVNRGNLYLCQIKHKGNTSSVLKHMINDIQPGRCVLMVRQGCGKQIYIDLIKSGECFSKHFTLCPLLRMCCLLLRLPTNTYQAHM